MPRELEFLAERRRALGERLAAHRAEKHLLQSDVARATNVDRSTVAHIERGQARGDEQFWRQVDNLLQAGGELLDEYRRLESAKHQQEVRLQEQRLAALKAQADDGHTTAKGGDVSEIGGQPLGDDLGFPGHLPAEVTSLVGRQHEISEIKQLLSSARLVTLTGVGGVGKSRLALRIAAQVRRAFPDGVQLVELAPVRDAALVAHTVVEALGVQEQSTRGPLAQLREYLRDRQLLLVVDNCEHLLDSVAELVGALLPAAASLRVLATSREPLGITGEHLWSVSPLAVPDAEEALPSDAVDRFAALTLFAERAVMVRPGFRVTAENLAAVAQLCHRLDGIPLAIELAAARLPTLSVEQIVQRLDDRFRLLIGPRRGVLPRHQTLRAAVQWSFELCSPAEQVLWSRVSVFAGGFDLDAAEAVCSDEDIASEDVFELVAGLVGKSVLIQQEHGGHTRYHLLDTLRQFGHEKLREAGEEASLRRRHRDWYQRLAEQADAQWFGPHQLECSHRVRSELGNLRTALDFCLTTPGESQVGLRMSAVLWLCWGATGFLLEGRHWLERALALDPAPTQERVTALWAAGYTAVMQGDVSGSVVLLEECRDLAHQLGDETALMHVAKNLGLAALVSGDLPQSVALQEEALQRCEALGERGHLPAEIRNELAVACFFQGKFDRTVALCEEVRALCEAHGEQWQLAFVFYHLGLTWWAQGELGHATAYAKDCLRIKHAFRDTVGIVLALELLAWTAVSGDEFERGAVLFGVAQQIWSSLNSPPLFGAEHWSAPHDKCVDGARAALGDSAFQHAYACGIEFPLDQAIVYALDDQEEEPVSGAGAKSAFVLTRRERQVAELVAQGLSNKEIAARLLIGQRTAEGHVKRVLAKLGFSSRAQIAAWAAKQPVDD